MAKLSSEKNILEKKLYSVITYLAPLEKFFLAPLASLGVVAASAIDAGIQKKIPGSGTTTLIISNKEMNDIMKIVQALEDSDIFLKGVTETIKKNEEARRVFFRNISRHCRVNLARKFIIRKRNCKSWFWSSFFGLLYFL